MAGWLKQWKVIGKSINRKTGEPYEYVISLGTDGHWECSCPSWCNQRGGRDDCKHILAKKFEIAYVQTAPMQFTVNNLNVTATIQDITPAPVAVGRKFRD